MSKPSVTQILKAAGLVDFSKVPRDILDRAQDFGTKTHKATELADLGRLNVATLDDGIVPYLNDWYKFTDDYKIKSVSSAIIEQRLESKKYGFTGKPDRIFTECLTIVDIKTSTAMYASTGIQLAGYQILAEENGIKIKRRLCVQLTGKGYKVEEYTDKSDKSVFLSCLNIYNFKQKKGEI
jgi:hypothetical protein